MSLLSCSCFVNVIPKCCLIAVNGPCNLKLHKIRTVNPNLASYCKGYKLLIENFLRSEEKKTLSHSKIFAAKNEATFSNDEWSFSEEDMVVDLDWNVEDDEGSPWEGAIVYKRSALTPHLEYCITLERLGLGKLSSEVSRSRASLMGLRVTKFVKEYVDGTPVLISIDVTKKRNRLRLDGLIRTVITLECNRCGEPAAVNVFSNFSLLLTEEPVLEPELIDMEVIYEEDRFKDSAGLDMDGEFDDSDVLINLDDRLHFPLDQKEIDISKHIRDAVHLKITIDALCDPLCKGLCLKCGVNLNSRSCSCTRQEGDGVSYGPFGNLRNQMQSK